MIAASAVLVVVAFITLIIGIFQDGLGLIWMSIASSVLAAIFLLLGVVRSRPAKVATTGAAMPGTWGDAATTYEAPVVETAAEAPSGWSPDTTVALDEPPVEPAPAPIEEPVVEAPVAAPPRRAASSRPAGRTAASRSTTASRPAGSTRAAASRAGTGASRAAAARPARTPAAQVEVVVIPDRDKFHKGTCRYAKTSGAMKMTKSEARREGYKACGVCKP